MSKKYFVMLELDVRDGTNPRKWDWDDLIDTSGEEVIVKHVVCEEVYAGEENDDLNQPLQAGFQSERGKA